MESLLVGECSGRRTEQWGERVCCQVFEQKNLTRSGIVLSGPGGRGSRTPVDPGPRPPESPPGSSSLLLCVASRQGHGSVEDGPHPAERHGVEVPVAFDAEAARSPEV